MINNAIGIQGDRHAKKNYRFFLKQYSAKQGATEASVPSDA